MIINSIAGGGGGGMTLGNLPLGAVVWVPIDVQVYSSNYTETTYINRPFFVAHKGLPGSMYDKSCDGVWLVGFESGGGGTLASGCLYAGSNFDSSLNITFYNAIKADVRTLIKTAKIPYYSSSYQTGANGLSRNVFVLNAVEVGATADATFGAKLDWFDTGSGTESRGKRIAYQYQTSGPYFYYYPSVANKRDSYLLRPTDSSTSQEFIAEDGNRGVISYDSDWVGARPTFIMNEETKINDRGIVTA